MSKQRKKAYEVLVLFHEEIVKEYGITEIDTQIIVQPTMILATNDSEAVTLANRLIPDEQAKRIELVEVRVRNF